MELGLDPEEEITNMEAEEAIDVLQPDPLMEATTGPDGKSETVSGTQQRLQGKDEPSTKE